MRQLHCWLLFLLLLLVSQCGAKPRLHPLTPIQEELHEARKKIQQTELQVTPQQQRTLSRLARQLQQQAAPPLPAIAYNQPLQQRSGFVCSQQAPPPSLLDFDKDSLWRRLPSHSNTGKSFANLYDIFPILTQDGFRLAFLACSSCEHLFPSTAPRHCSWIDRGTITSLHQETDFLSSCSIPQALWSATQAELHLRAGSSELQLQLDSLHLPAALPCHPPYQLSAATMVWAFREMFKTLQWIEYHRLLGVQHFWVYDNIRDPQRRLQKLLHYHIQTGLVTYVHDPVLSQTIGDRHFLANRHAANRFGLSWSEWLWIGDVDEYLIPPSCVQSVPELLHSIAPQVASVSVPGPKFTYDEARWEQWSAEMEQSAHTHSFLLDIELYTQQTDFAPLERQKSITRGAALLDVANHQPTSFRPGPSSTIQQLQSTELQFAHLFFHPWGRLPPQGSTPSSYDRLQHCYGLPLRERLQFVIQQLQLSPTELHWYQWGYQQDQLAVNLGSKDMVKNTKRRHPGGW